MLSVGEEQVATSAFFSPASKCCTYIPSLPNFLVGRILSATDPAPHHGRESVEKRLEARVAVTPLGIAQPPVYSLLYRNSEHFFGRSQSLRCPHYTEDGGRCGIWENRNAICVTWFCKHVRGDLGQTFWRGSLLEFLWAVERDLARWCVLELDMTGEVLRHLVATADWKSEHQIVSGESLDNRVNGEEYTRIWGEWRGREREFFLRCAELVNPLAFDEILAIAGPDVRAYAQLTRRGFARLTAGEVPTTLHVGPMQLVQIHHGMTRVSTYNDGDPLDIPQVVMESLQYFDGRPTADAIAAIQSECGVRLENDLIRKMVDFRLLVPSK